MVFRRLASPARLAALVTGTLVLVTGCGDDGGGGDTTGNGSGADTTAVQPPAGDVPESVAEVELLPLTDGDGNGDAASPGTLGDLLGDTPIVLNFFASWCAPCVEEMPDLEAVHRDHGEQVAFLGMAMQDGEDRARDVVETTGVTYPTYQDPRGDAFTFFGGTNMPTTVFLAADGEILDVHSRPLNEAELRDRVDELLEGP